jgi:hypothetical protein
MASHTKRKLSQSLKQKWKDPEHRSAVSAKLQVRGGVKLVFGAPQSGDFVVELALCAFGSLAAAKLEG